MAKQSRINKYKDLRDHAKANTDASLVSRDIDQYTDFHSFFKDEETLDFNVKKEVPRVEQKSIQPKVNDIDDFDFMQAFSEFGFKKDIEPVEKYKPTSKDTLVEPLTFERINEQVDEELERALNRVRTNIGQEDYNTRLDILNKIRKASDVFETISDDDHQLRQQIDEEVYKYNSQLNRSDDSIGEEIDYSKYNEEYVKPTYQKEIKDYKSDASLQFNDFNINNIDYNDEEDLKSKVYSKTVDQPVFNEPMNFNNDNEDKVDDTLSSFFSRFKEDKNENISSNLETLSQTLDFSAQTNTTKVFVDDEEDEYEDSPLVIKILNGIIIILVIALLCIAGYFAKVMLF